MLFTCWLWMSSSNSTDAILESFNTLSLLHTRELAASTWQVRRKKFQKCEELLKNICHSWPHQKRLIVTNDRYCFKVASTLGILSIQFVTNDKSALQVHQSTEGFMSLFIKRISTSHPVGRHILLIYIGNQEHLANGFLTIRNYGCSLGHNFVLSLHESADWLILNARIRL